jgi:hypothetical protein
LGQTDADDTSEDGYNAVLSATWGDAHAGDSGDVFALDATAYATATGLSAA